MRTFFNFKQKLTIYRFKKNLQDPPHLWPTTQPILNPFSSSLLHIFFILS
jgi:hypothetical protein